jgi:hypothetical protein
MSLQTFPKFVRAPISYRYIHYGTIC